MPRIRAMLPLNGYSPIQLLPRSMRKTFAALPAFVIPSLLSAARGRLLGERARNRFLARNPQHNGACKRDRCGRTGAKSGGVGPVLPWLLDAVTRNFSAYLVS